MTMNLRLFFAAFVIYGCVIFVATLGMLNWLGAHHFWDLTVALLGGPVAVPLLLIAMWRPLAGLSAGLLAAGLGLGAAAWGKLAFAASYAENTFAGQCWFLGWIAGLGGVIAVLAVLLSWGIAAMQRA